MAAASPEAISRVTFSLQYQYARPADIVTSSMIFHIYVLLIYLLQTTRINACIMTLNRFYSMDAKTEYYRNS